MDDDESIQTFLNEMLQTLDYSVLLAGNGEKAVDLIHNNHSSLNIVAMIMDLTIRFGSGGKQAVTEIRKINPQIPIFVISGYSHHPAIENPAEYGFTASLSKPFQIENLTVMLDKYLLKEALVM